MGRYESGSRDAGNNKEERATPAKAVLEVLHDLVYITAIMLVVFTFFVRMVVVSGSSMFDTLVNGDYLLVVNNPLCGELEQGDIVVASMDRFKNGEAIVKRVIATEGQKVDINFEAGIVYVDGTALDEPYIHTATTRAEGIEFPLTVDKGHVFVMGDNRVESVDSRSSIMGCVSEERIIGKILFRLWPLEDFGLIPES